MGIAIGKLLEQSGIVIGKKWKQPAPRGILKKPKSPENVTEVRIVSSMDSVALPESVLQIIDPPDTRPPDTPKLRGMKRKLNSDDGNIAKWKRGGPNNFGVMDF